MATVYVDVHEPGSATIIGGGHQAYVGTDAPRRLYTSGPWLFIEDADTEELIGYASSYMAAAHTFAQHHGIADPQIEIDYEYRH